MTHFNRFASLLCVAVLVLASGCSEEPSVGDPNIGNISNQSFVAVGNSLTAGYQSGALFESGQRYSFANLIAQQLGAEFVMPLMPGDGTGQIIKLVSMNPVTLQRSAPAIVAPSNLQHPKPYNNLGIPGAILADAIDTSSATQRSTDRENPFYMMVLRDQSAFGRSVLDQALAQQPTFMTFWYGNNDVLAYAVSGGTTGTDATRTLPTEQAAFAQRYKMALDMIKTLSANTKVVVGNIPDVVTIPYFTTIKHVMPNPSDPSQLLTIYITDRNGTVRAATADDLILLSAQERLGQGMGLLPQNPLTSEYVLDVEEKAVVQQAVIGFNSIISTEAAAHGYPVTDVNMLLKRINENGYSVAGETFTTAFITGGLFSLDGVHPSSKGAGIIANEFIRVMNDSYHANIRYIAISMLPGIPVPLSKASAGYSLSWKIPPGTFDGLKSAFTR